MKNVTVAPPKKLVIFASGNGSNAARICAYFQNNSQVTVAYLFSNNPKAKVFHRLKPYQISGLCFNREELKTGIVLNTLNEINPDLIVLAGFLLKIPKEIIESFPQKIINIHPSLLPKYGGKGMYGEYVHQAVKENKESETGITIHYVDEAYDRGAIIFQAKVLVSVHDTASDISKKVRALEQQYFPLVIKKLLFPQPI